MKYNRTFFRGSVHMHGCSKSRRVLPNLLDGESSSAVLAADRDFINALDSEFNPLKVPCRIEAKSS